MAIADTGFTGRIQNLIYYKRGNRTCVRTMPERVRQTKATKARAGEFGRASRIGKAIREVLLPVIPNPKDMSMQTRLVAALFQWLQSANARPADLAGPVSQVTGLDLSDPGHSVRERWRVSFQVDHPSSGLIQIRIPAFVPKDSILAPAKTVSVTCKISAGSCDAATGTALGSASLERTFVYDRTPVAAETISMKLPTPKGSLIVTGIVLEYRVNKNGYPQTNTNKNFMPANIVHAMYK
ncbi:MAG: hypothetical protein ACHQD7_00420 [Chitinophagales bacterium]